VPLELRGLAIMDPPGRGVRFAGYPTSRIKPPMVICEVSAGALRTVGGMPDASFGELMGIFEIYKDQILAVASAKYDAGEHRPCVTADDFAGVCG
jgi:hypothetical protein